jgi:hypothetical protein
MKKKNRQTKKEKQANNIAIAENEYNSSLYLSKQAITVISNII